jgi:hypothetical protein
MIRAGGFQFTPVGHARYAEIMTDLELLNKAINERGYLVFKDAYFRHFEPGDIVIGIGGSDDRFNQFSGHPFSILCRTDRADWLAQQEALNWTPCDIEDGAYYRCTTD